MATQVAGAGDLTDVIAVLWTWLETQLIALGSLSISEAGLRASAMEAPKFTGAVTDDDLATLRTSPLTGAAELLVRIGCHAELKRLPTWAKAAVGYDGAEVVVIWKRADLAIKAAGGPKASVDDALPPAAMERRP